jgi:signal transduction histidine kinase
MDAVEAVLPAARTAGVRLLIDLGKDPAWLDGDGDRLVQALDNVLSNAIKFAARPDGEIGVRLGVEHGQVRIVIGDNGPGVAPEDRERVFERFHRGEFAVCQATPGAGLGLPIVRAIVEAHAGTVTLGASAAGGAEVTIVLPGRPA